MLENLHVRSATETDAPGIGAVLAELVAVGKRKKSCDTQFVLEHYVEHPDRLQCFVAENIDGVIVGFQSLKYARIGNVYGAPDGWGIIGTHIRPSFARRGVGSQLFSATKIAAEAAGIAAIDALIGISNPDGLAYYDAMGFWDYREVEGAIGKRFDIGGSN